ncbi:ISL3 family transposase [bacterium]|nr:ISL3 family transposase [bacterium]
MRTSRLWARLLGVEKTVIEDVQFDVNEDAIIASVRPKKSECDRCGECHRRSPKYDRGAGRRRWRIMDLGTMKAYLEADSPRVCCPVHGVVVAAVPWARHAARFTQFFDDIVAWLATNCSKSAVQELMRISWRTVGRIIERVGAEARERVDLLGGLRRIGIDEISYRKGHRYITVVVDHDSRRLVWAAPGRDMATVNRFFDALGPEGCAAIEQVSADGGSWISSVVNTRCPQAKLCMDPFHVVQWATDALDQVRRAVWNDARNSGQKAQAKDLKGARFALWKNPEDLTDRQQGKLASIQATNKPLYRAYLLKEQLRQVFVVQGERGIQLLKKWLAWACRCRIEPFVKLSRTIREYLPAIHEALRLGLSNALTESTNTKIRLIARRAFGFHSPEALIALAMLDLAGLCPPLPGR